MEQAEIFEDVGRDSSRRKVLTDRERHVIFVREYVKTGNATQSAVAAGYSKKTAASQGSRLTMDPAIARAIRHERARLRMVTPDLSVERLLQELGCMALSDRRDLFDEDGNALKVHELDEPTARAVASVDVVEVEVTTEKKIVKRRNHHVRLGDKRAAIELIAKIKGYMAPEKHEHKVLSLEALVTGESEDVAA